MPTHRPLMRTAPMQNPQQQVRPQPIVRTATARVHEIVTADDPHSPVNHANIPITCGKCHGQKFLMESNGESSQAFVSYQQSVHGRAVEKGSTKAAVCTDCHGSHEILAANEQNSPISKFNVPATCGKCHSAIQQTFMASIHGQGIARGNNLAPVCTDCHGIHSIKRPGDPNAAVSERNLSLDICARCHRGCPSFAGVRRARPARLQLHGQLSRAGRRGRLRRCRQLLELPWRPRHSALQRSALHHQPRQPAGHLRQVPQGRHAEVHPHPRSSRRRRSLQRPRLCCRPLGPPHLHRAHPCRHRRHVPAQRDHLAQQSRSRGDTCRTP